MDKEACWAPVENHKSDVTEATCLAHTQLMNFSSPNKAARFKQALIILEHKTHHTLVQRSRELSLG